MSPTSARTPRPFRFGHQLRPAALEETIADAVRAEEAGFDIALIPDHIGVTMASPMLVLAAIARETTTIRLGTFVLNNEMRNPVQLAWEAATLDQLSGGRFELGLGAGHTPHEFAGTGIPREAALLRKRRLNEAVEIIRSLLNGDTVDHGGDTWTLDGAAVRPPVQDHVPILVGGNGDTLLTHAAQHADIIGLQGLGRTGEDGHRHAVKWSAEHLDQQLALISRVAEQHGRSPELNALVQRVEITDDRSAVCESMLSDILEPSPTLDDLLTTPYLAIGTHDQIVQQFRDVRERWGISYFVSRNLDDMAPVVSELRGT